jgi:nucleoside-diphosphate-sugar epimerase
MKVLILGSRGQIGEHLFYFLKKKKYKVYGIDIVNSSSEDLRNNSNKKFQKLIKKVDFVFFLAFDVGGSVYLENYQKSYDFLMNNIAIMNNVFTQLKKNNKKFIFATSQMSNMSFSPYGVLKKVGEHLSESNKLKGISVKFWNVYGIEHDLKKAHVITDFILKGKKNIKVKMRTNGLEARDFLYADDCCEALELIMNNFNKFKKEKFIDLNTGKYTKIKEIAKIISRLFLNKGKKVIFVPAISKDKIQMNKKNTGKKFIFNYWKPKFTLEQGINKVFQHYVRTL